MNGGGSDACPRHAERMPESYGAPVRVDVLGLVRKAELAQDGESLAGESLVELDDVESGDLQTEALDELPRRRDWADPHDARRHARRRHAEHARPRLQPVPLDGLGGG